MIPDFISAEEECQLISDLDQLPWDKSQSGITGKDLETPCVDTGCNIYFNIFCRVATFADDFFLI